MWALHSKLKADLELNIDTDRYINLRSLGIESANLAEGVHYEAVSVIEFIEALSVISPMLDDTWTFVDLGCGLGRALALAGHFPFRRILGIDFSEKLIEGASANLRTLKEVRPSFIDWELRFSDAADYLLEDDKTVLFMFNPFSWKVIKRVVSNLTRSPRSDRPELYMVYVNPIFHQEISETQLFQTITFQQTRFAIYRMLPGVVLAAISA